MQNSNVCYDIISKLISFDTSDPMKSKKHMVDFIEIYLNQFGIQALRIKGKNGHSDCLLALINGPANENGIILSGHIDVVNAQNSLWQTDPFKSVIKDNRLYARGSCDMKSFIGCVLSVLPALRSMKLKAPIYLALTDDEETSCQNIVEVLSTVKNNYPLPKLAIIGEPTHMRAIRSHRGAYDFKITIQGKSSHAGRPDLGINAIYIAAKLISFIEELSKAYSNFEQIDKSTVFNVGLVNGGNSINVVPEKASISWEVRPSSHNVISEVTKKIKSYMAQLNQSNPGLRIIMDSVCNIPPLEFKKENNDVELFLNEMGLKKNEFIGFATEAGFFHQAGIPAVVCGPGSIEQAHKVDEYIELSQIQACQELVKKTAIYLQKVKI